jgi:hypothetical protein
MSDEREKLLEADEEPEVEAHKVIKAANEEKASDDESDTPDVEAHKVLKKLNL